MLDAPFPFALTETPGRPTPGLLLAYVARASVGLEPGYEAVCVARASPGFDPGYEDACLVAFLRKTGAHFSREML